MLPELNLAPYLMPLAYGFRASVQSREPDYPARKSERAKRDLASAAVGSIFVGP
jgi:hypothetical protein